MSDTTSERLKRQSAKITNFWQGQASKEVKFLFNNSTLAIQNSIGEFLNHVADSLSTVSNSLEARAQAEATKVDNSDYINKYNIDQLVYEYQLLRRVIFDVMEEEEILLPVEREVILAAVEKEIKEAVNQFTQSERSIQEQFNQILGHDLRGPLTAAELYAQLFLKKPVADHCVNVVRGIYSSMDRLELMINDLLDAGKIKSGEPLKLDFAFIDLDSLLVQITKDMNELHGNRINYKSIGVVEGRWNQNGMKRVVENLIINALKYSTPGSPVDIELKKIDQTVVLSVHNIGNPIPVNDKSLLFEQYQRSKSAESHKGLGLGLSVVKGIVEAHNGKVEVESSAVAGTTFTVTLPLVVER